MTNLKIVLMVLILSLTYCANIFATDYCPTRAQITAGQFNGWVVYVATTPGGSTYAPATPAQIKQFSTTKESFIQAIWDSRNVSTGTQNAVCLYYPGGPGLLSRTEPQPTVSKYWINSVDTYFMCNQAGNVKLCPYN